MYAYIHVMYVLLLLLPLTYQHHQYLPAELERLYIPTWKDPRAWFWPRALRREEESDSPAPSLPEIVAQRQMQL